MARRRRDKDGNEILTPREQIFVEGLAQGKSQAQAATDAGYAEKNARITASKKLTDPNISAAVQQRIQGVTGATTDETLLLMASHMRADIADFQGCFDESGNLDLVEAKRRGISRLIKSITTQRDGSVKIEFHNSQSAAKSLHEMLRLEAGAPTAITRHEDAAEMERLRSKAEGYLQEAILLHDGDRAAALAWLLEVEPTLGKYVN